MLLCKLPCIYFNPRSLAGATFHLLLCKLPCIYFNPRSLAGATFVLPYPPPNLSYFNPRSLAGATISLALAVRASNISIHAPSRERPPTLQHCNADLHFNPRSLAGATADGNSPRTRTLKFQSTLPHGSDNIGVKFRNNGSISIHAPSRERQIEVMSIRQLSIFQSSLPRGSDSPNSTALCSDQAFQSSLPRGSDVFVNWIIMHYSISILAPSRERLGKVCVLK